MSISEMLREACAALKGRWLEGVMLTFVYLLVSVMVSVIPYVGNIASIFLLPLGWGFAVTFLRNARGEDDPFNISKMFDGYKDFSRIFTTMLLMNIYILLWTLLLIVPGIIKSLSYSMTPYILADNPEMKNNEAIELSMAMMEGHKLDLFLINLLFALLAFLSILTLGIAYLWLVPFMQASYTKFYEELKKDFYVNR